ncbi:uncharacterized protein si:dkey-256h2.1 [Phyllopteryx taeniolatus]|uniref:uncharacterized protein si:dkey-256h2.1 n=1 Tax=Phyllopteryx taeniolatus TaxID=161469 RepID=UPI002AD33A98|nr:uncharacterized protein si:dkey-256h2.1 [Phyllopteryx taeniolatus]
MLRSVSPVLYFLLVVSAHVTFAAEGIPRRRLKLADDEASRAASESRDNSVESRQSGGWDVPVIVKRLDARYDWLTGRRATTRYELRDAGDG